MPRLDVMVRRPGGRALSALVAGIVAALLLVVALPASAQRGPDAGSENDPGVPVDSEETPAAQPDVADDAEVDGGADDAGGTEGADGRNTATAGGRGGADDGDRTVQIVDTDNSRHPQVDLVVAVPPVLAGELSADSFALTEGGSVRAIQVAKLRDALEVVVVIDTSGSMDGAPMAAAIESAKQFVGSLDDETRVAVVGFGGEVTTAAGFDAGRAEVLRAIDGLSARGETALYDALAAATDSFVDPSARRFVVVLSDGTDTASSTTAEQAAAALTESGASLYAITLQSPEADFAGLETLVEDVDGQLVSAADSTSLEATYSAIASRLTNLYQVSFQARSTGTSRVALSIDANGVLAVASGDVDLGAPAVDPDAGEETPTRPVVEVGEPDVVVAPETSFLKSDTALLIGAGGLFLGLVLVLFLVFSAEPKGPSAFERLNRARNGAAGRTGGGRSGLAALADRASSVADRVLEKQSKRGALDAALEKAGMDMRPGEFIMATIGAALGMGVLGFIMFGPIHALIGLVLGLFGGRTFVNMKASQRQKKFGAQLGDTLMMIAGSLRAGHGIAEAIDTVASQASSPTAEEFTRAVSEARIGRDMVDSLYDIAERTGSEDFIWVVRAISINRELGGDLAEILDNVGETIRDRNRLRDQVKALSAEGKVSALILFALPVLVGAWVQVSNPKYMADMTNNTPGKVMFGAAVMCLIVGGLWLKKLVKVEF